MKRYLHLSQLIFLLFSVFIQAQSLKKPLESLTYDELKEAFFKNEGKIEIQKKYAKAFLNRAKKENNTPKIARGYYYYSLLYNDDRKIIYFDSIINNVKLPTSEKNFPFVAYHKKGLYLSSKFKYIEAINNYILLEKIAKSKNPLFYYKAKNEIAILKCEFIGEIKEALPLYLECYDYYKHNKKNPEVIYDYERILFALADVYKSLHKKDSTTYFNKLGFYETKKSKNEYFQHLFILNEGANQMYLKNYEATLDSVTKALPVLTKYQDEFNIMAAYYYKGKAYYYLNNQKQAIYNYKKVDSIYRRKKILLPEFSDCYPYLINYYKNKGDLKTQLKYVSAFLEIQTKYQKDYKTISNRLKNDYDLPNLVKDKEKLINSLKNDGKKYFWIVFTLLFFVVILVVIGFFQINQKNKYKQNFEKIINKTLKPEILNDVIITQTQKKENILSNSLMKELDGKLKKFENEKQYKNSQVSIQYLANEFTTNTKYLSSYINEYKKKTFINYINDLRVDNIIEELKQNKNLRKYTIAALAEEAGFNTAESFSNAFYKRTEIKPSFFVKELNRV